MAENSSIRLDIGGRHNVCLIPGTIAVLDREAGAQSDRVRIDLKQGAVFSHVNLKAIPTDFTVKTPQALAAARGTDFVTVALPEVTDVWIQEGTVELLELSGASVGTVSSTEGARPRSSASRPPPPNRRASTPTASPSPPRR
ncbi:MAG: FecR domain-containing protein [Bdellovibrionaceae bacterium]|nr:FecR domain-containing protein [Pseudobdellovibrionaceae bacterium]